MSKTFYWYFLFKQLLQLSHVAAHGDWVFLGPKTKQLILGILGTTTKPSKTMLCLQLLLDGA